jgi:hypothetical protein
VLGDRDRVPRRGVDDHDATLGRGVHVDVVDADAGAADDLQPRARLDDVRRDLRLTAHDEAFVVADDLQEVVARQSYTDVDLGVAFERVDPVLRNRVDDEDCQALPPTRSRQARD